MVDESQHHHAECGKHQYHGWVDHQRDHHKQHHQQHHHWPYNPCGGKIHRFHGPKRGQRGHVLNDLDLPSHVSREQVERLQAEMVTMPQAELVTEHQFSPGMYMRKLFRPAGTLIVGKVHKEPHFFLCAKGEIIAWTESGMKRLQAGDVIESKPGTKRVTLAVTDAIGITIHRTDKTDLDEIEAELIEPDPSALFDARNKLKITVDENRGLT